ncbi:MAG: co-chaperone DjlA [Pseudomonadota bacterium]
MIAGKLIAGALGLMAGGWPGLVIGALLGHVFDRALGKTLGLASPENLRRIQESFFTVTFQLSGFLAKADGRVSEQEIAHTEQLFSQLGLSAVQRQRAIALFREGTSEGFQPEPAVRDFLSVCGGQRQVLQTLFLFLISLAHADGELEPTEHAALVRIAGLTGLSREDLEALLEMVRAQGRFQGGSASGSTPDPDSLAAAYSLLGASASDSDRDLKRAYRKRMSENHPDKLIAKGVPQEMIELATQRSQDIQAAYELIRKDRGIRR